MNVRQWIGYFPSRFWESTFRKIHQSIQMECKRKVGKKQQMFCVFFDIIDYAVLHQFRSLSRDSVAVVVCVVCVMFGKCTANFLGPEWITNSERETVESHSTRMQGKANTRDEKKKLKISFYIFFSLSILWAIKKRGIRMTNQN